MIIKKRDDQSINKILENHRQQLNDLLENEDVSLTDNEIVIKSKILDNYIIEYINSKKSNSK
ncbi:MAG: Spo0E family sporulation regulatory protein-aspartic acid phosphatase [Maledivibacter sp.]|nr:Spo0E family sporulation regulatory protein-aspartic acid phosphatase [Maledivibacter sp.]